MAAAVGKIANERQNTIGKEMDAKTDDKSAGKCPFTGSRGRTNR